MLIEELYPRLPGSVELDTDSKRRLIGGLKSVLKRLHERGVLPFSEYSEMLQTPARLQTFIDAFEADRTVAADLLVDNKGRPVTDDYAPLSCGISLAQIGQMLVYTTAKRLFTESDAAKNAGRVTEGERKLASLKNLLAFPWQLPLLKLYYFLFVPQQINELGRELLLVRTAAGLEVLAGTKVDHIRKARRLTGEEFALAVHHRPEAVAGLADYPADAYPLLRSVLGERVWDFYARDFDYFDLVTSLDREVLEVFGPRLADMAPEAVRALSRMSIDKLDTFLKAFEAVFGADTYLVLVDPAASKQVLPPMAKSFDELSFDSPEFAQIVKLKCQAVKTGLAPFLQRKRAALAS